MRGLVRSISERSLRNIPSIRRHDDPPMQFYSALLIEFKFTLKSNITVSSTTAVSLSINQAGQDNSCRLQTSCSVPRLISGGGFARVLRTAMLAM